MWVIFWKVIINQSSLMTSPSFLSPFSPVSFTFIFRNHSMCFPVVVFWFVSVRLSYAGKTQTVGLEEDQGLLGLQWAYWTGTVHSTNPDGEQNNNTSLVSLVGFCNSPHLPVRFPLSEPLAELRLGWQRRWSQECCLKGFYFRSDILVFTEVDACFIRDYTWFNVLRKFYDRK